MSRSRVVMRITLAVGAGLAALVALGVALAADGVPAAYAISTGPHDPPDSRCLAGLSIRGFTATPASVRLGRPTTLRWSVEVPSGCPQLRVELNGQPVGRQGALRLAPIADSTYALDARWAGRRYGIATAALTVVLPHRVTIDGNHLAPLLAQAVSTPGTRIRVLNGVALDLSSSVYENMRVARGVRLIGGRTAREPGPLLYTRKRKTLLLIRSDEEHDVRDVRISGLRMQGPDMGVVDGGSRSTAILVDSAVDVEIDHNALFGWKNSAIRVRDEQKAITYPLNTWAVRIHDNYIHHNQEKNSAGYGVVVGSGAYALIERNVFDYNRHAISGDGSDWSGYRALRNLMLRHGGKHNNRHTHQFDMHGQKCWTLCGTAGHYISIRLNSFLYTAGAAIKIRGTPQRGAFVISNVFAHDSVGDAVKHTPLHGGMNVANNRDGIDGSERYGMCDFDGDGKADRFMATGQTWWYASRGARPWLYRHWVYLNTSQKLLSELALGQFDRDHRCDVVAGGLISSGGRSPWRPRERRGD